MTVKVLAAGVAAVAAVGTVAAGVTSIVSGPAAVQLQPVVFSAPLPQDPAQNLPSPGDLSSICTNFTNPGVNWGSKNGLVEGGFSSDEGHMADHNLRDAYRDGKFPQSYNVTNIQPAGPNAATADVAITGPKFSSPVSQNLTFVNQGGGWMLRHDSALSLLNASTS